MGEGRRWSFGAGFPPGVGSPHAGVDCSRGQGTGVRKMGHAEEGRSLPIPQSQPLSLTMCDISMMYFPSLYFWLVSKACSYFQPSVVLQLSQKMSATEWSPVSRRRCSAGPQPTLTLSRKTRTQHTVGLLCQSIPPTYQGIFAWGELEASTSAVHPLRVNA